MKNEKKVIDTKGKQNATGINERSAGKLQPAATDIAPATKKARANAGRGLANEGTATSYADQNRND